MKAPKAPELQPQTAGAAYRADARSLPPSTGSGKKCLPRLSSSELLTTLVILRSLVPPIAGREIAPEIFQHLLPPERGRRKSRRADF